jgi:hypothetical protein
MHEEGRWGAAEAGFMQFGHERGLNPWVCCLVLIRRRKEEAGLCEVYGGM